MEKASESFQQSCRREAIVWSNWYHAGGQQDSGLWAEELHGPPNSVTFENCVYLVIIVFFSPFNLYDVNEATIIKNWHLNFLTLISISFIFESFLSNTGVRLDRR